MRRFLIIPFARDHALSPAQITFNRQMSQCRVAVEWGFMLTSRCFAFIDFKKNLKSLLTPIGSYYVAATFFQNCVTCLRGHNMVSRYFQMTPPTLSEYLNNE